MGTRVTVAATKSEEASKLEWLPLIDSHSLSNSELYALSLCSLSSHHRHLLTPNIDPSLFNESAGSRRQTYSRPDSSPTGRRCRLAGLLPLPKPPPLPPHDPENRVIIHYLKQLIRDDPKFDQVHLAPPPSAPPPQPLPVKRKRGRKPKLKLHLDHCYRGFEILNRNSVAVDLSALANADDPFAPELKRRTDGLRSEEELLGFLSNLPGQWGSRRKKRRIVDAADFGDVLPVRWKLLLGLKRKEGRAWIYCRRYISPSGQHFVSCKDVSLYLQSHFGHADSQLQVSRGSENVAQEQRVFAENSAGFVTRQDQDERQIVAVDSDVPELSVANERVKEVAFLELENLADVQIHDMFECHKCSMSFDEKDLYLQHLLSVHQRTTRRYRLGSSVGDGVIIKDGKFECQFCHKVFMERRRYNGHVGIHVRNYVRGVEYLQGQANEQRTDKSLVREDVPLRISKMDALIEIAQNSIMEDSVTEPHSSAKLNRVPAPEIAGGDFDQGSPPSECELQMEDSLTGNNLNAEVEEICDDNGVIDDVALIVEGLDQSGIDMDEVSQNPLLPLHGNHVIQGSEKSEDSGCTNTVGKFKLDEDKSNKTGLEISLEGLRDVPVSTIVQEMIIPASEKNVGGKQFCSVDCELENVREFRELRLDEIDKCDFSMAQDSPTLPDVPTEMANNTMMECTHTSSAQFGSQEVMLNMDGRSQLSTVCVWCGIEFNHEAVDSEIQPDSVGFMCPTCKAKISGQINVLDSGSPNAGHL